MTVKKISAITATIVFMVLGTALAPQSLGPLNLTGITANADPNLIPLHERNAHCIKQWQQTTAFNDQECRGINVRWNSYWASDLTLSANPGTLNDGTHAHLYYSRCLVHVKCEYASEYVGKGEYNGVLKYRDVEKLRRCRADPTKLDTSCESLTQQGIHDIVAQAIEEQEQQYYYRANR
ncbi:MAG: hypothetical protein OXE41_09695 [Gammaproteobacteria bacterium]|nr:hypothetical protein [Gammaproteobacteria bacterium]MCY4275646.1 hypothetical protein [Gammaproteobacteria bacterium]